MGERQLLLAARRRDGPRPGIPAAGGSTSASPSAVAVLSFGYWTRALARDPSAIGAHAGVRRRAVHGGGGDGGALHRHEPGSRRRVAAHGVDAPRRGQTIAGRATSTSRERAACGSRRGWRRGPIACAPRPSSALLNTRYRGAARRDRRRARRRDRVRGRRPRRERALDVRAGARLAVMLVLLAGVRQRRQSPARAGHGAAAAKSPSGCRSAPAAAASRGSCSPRASCSPSSRGPWAWGLRSGRRRRLMALLAPSSGTRPLAGHHGCWHSVRCCR